MYSISNVIVGVPLTSALDKLLREWEVNDDPRWREWEDLGFETFYHGGADQAMGFCGVHLGRFDECGEYILVNGDKLNYVGFHGGSRVIPLKPTVEQEAEAKAKVDALDPEIRKLCPEFGVYIVQSTS